MKKRTRFLSMAITLVMLVSVIVIGTTSASAASAEISYSFAKSQRGFAEGTITFQTAPGTTESYTLYWADEEKALEGFRALGTLSGSGEITMPPQTVIPPDAKKIIAVSQNSTDLSVASAVAVYEIPKSRQLSVDSADALYTFGAISDPQLANDSYGSGSYPYDEVHLAAAFETLSERDVDFTIVSGDIVNDQNGNQTYAAEYKRYQQILADSSYSMPVYESNGNHDVGTVWNKNGNYYNNDAPFIKATGLDSTAETINAGKPYFEITEPTTGDHFIFMALEGGFYTDRGTQFSTAQLDWLEGLLKKYSTDGKNIFIIEHANVQGWGSGDKLTTPYYYDLGLNNGSADVQRFIDLMETYKDCVIITGHTHLELGAQYNYSDNNGTSAVMIHNSAIGGVRRLVNGSVDRSAVKGLSEGYIVEVYEDFILFNGTNMYHNEIIPLCSYIIPFNTTTDAEKPSVPQETESTTEGTTPADTSAPDVSVPDTTVSTVPAETESSTAPSEEITVTLKSSGSSTDWVLNSDSRVVTLIDNATGKEYTATLTSSGWEVTVPSNVQDITFHRVKNDAVSHTWLASDRGTDVNYFITGDARGHWENEATPEYADVFLPGSFNSWDQSDAFEKTSDANVVTRTLELEAGTYTFKVMEGSTWLGNSGKINDTTTTSSTGGWVMSASDGDCTLVATGGTYTFNFNTSTKKLIVLHNAAKSIASVGADLVYDFGDASMDGTVNIKDATLIQKHAASLLTLEGGALILADVNADKSVNVKDATLIQKFVAGLVSKFPADEVIVPTETTTPSTVPETSETVAPSEDTTPTVSEPDFDTAEAEKILDTYYTYSSYDQYQALKNAVLTEDYKNVPDFITALQEIVVAIGGKLLDPDAPVSDEITVYFTNNYDWSAVNAYIWGGAGTKATWPGEAMTFAKTNSQGQDIYSVTLSFDDYQNIIFTDGSKQTVDITLTGEDGIGYYISGESSGKYACSTYTYA